MQEPVIQWGAIGIFGSILLGWVAISLLMQWQERKRRRISRGFRNMRSTAHHQRERSRRVRWGEQQPAGPVATQHPVQRNVGWR